MSGTDAHSTPARAGSSPAADPLGTGSALLAAGRAAEAVPFLEAARERAPSPLVAARLGLALWRTGQRERGLALLAEAARGIPPEPEALGHLGNALREAGRAAEAVPWLAEAARLQPADAIALSNLAVALRAAGRPEEAAEELARALELEPERAQLHQNRAAALFDLGRTEEAAAALEHALALAPGNALAWRNLGRARAALGHDAGAREALERALALEPALAAAWVDLGALAEIVGELDEAARCQREALALEPGLALAWLNLARLGRLDQEAPIEARLARGGLSTQAECELWLALGFVLERQGRHERAFDAFERGNRLRRSLLPAWDREADRMRVERIAEVFDAALFARHAKAGKESELPVYVVGMPRSGTTLVESILAGLPALAARGELEVVPRAARALAAELGAPFPVCADALDAPRLARLADDLIAGFGPVAPGTLRATDKLPQNLELLGLIALALPNARVVVCRRDPLDTCLSAWRQPFEGARLRWSYDLEDLGARHRAWDGLLAHWKRVLPLAMHEVRYEELVAEPERVARDLCAFLELPFDPACLAFHSARRDVRTASAADVRRPVHTESVGRAGPHAARLGALRRALGLDAA